MMGIGDIRKIAAIRQVPEIVVEKDYVLDWLLWGISKVPEFCKRLVFKGGTALHKFYFSDWRFSEDLDFTTTSHITEKDLRGVIPQVCYAVTTNSGILMRCRDIIPEGEQMKEWCIKSKIEYVGPRGQSSGNLPIINLDIMNDEFVVDKPLKKCLVNPYPDIKEEFNIKTYTLEEVTAEKIRSVLHQRCWTRDVYDLWRLLKKCRGEFDMHNVISIYRKKCFHRQLNPAIPGDFGSRIARLERQWESGLRRQLHDVPSFRIVKDDVTEVLKELSTAENMEGGFSMIELQYSIRYKRDKIEIEVQGDKDFVENKFQELLALSKKEVGESLPQMKSTMPKVESGRKPSVSEFLRSKGEKLSHTDRILIFGYYLDKYEDITVFNTKDITQCYRRARTPLPKNFPAYIALLTKSGFVMEAPEKKDNRKAWQLTDTGSRQVEEKLSQPSDA